MSAGVAAGSIFREVGGVTVFVEYHVASSVAYLGVQVCGGIVENPESVCVCFLRAF